MIKYNDYDNEIFSIILLTFKIIITLLLIYNTYENLFFFLS